MNIKPTNVWKAPMFCTGVCTITLVLSLVQLFVLGSVTHGGPTPGAALFGGLVPLICFLPMAFWFVAENQKQTHEYIVSLETRIKELEADRS